MGFGDFFKFGKTGFIQASSANVGRLQNIVRRIGDAIIGGDFSGNPRGQNSIDIQYTHGDDTRVASGEHSLAIGSQNEASGQYSIALGHSSRATGPSAATAIGLSAVASGAQSIALGYRAQANTNGEAVIAGIILKLQTESSPVVIKKTVWHEGNDGAGSGLDADLLDGLSSNAFATSTHTHSHDTDLTGVSADDHHAQAHAHDGADGSGTLLASAITDLTAFIVLLLFDYVSLDFSLTNNSGHLATIGL